MEFSFDSLDTPALTKAHLSEMLHEQLGLNKREAKDYIEAFFEVIAAELVEGQDVKISGFGNFEIRSKAGRPGRNPRTGEPVPIPPKRVVTFKASAILKDQINKDWLVVAGLAVFLAACLSAQKIRSNCHLSSRKSGCIDPWWSFDWHLVCLAFGVHLSASKSDLERI